MMYAEALRQVTDDAIARKQAEAEQQVEELFLRLEKDLRKHLDKEASEGKSHYSLGLSRYYRRWFFGFWERRSSQYVNCLTKRVQRWCLDNGLHCQVDKFARDQYGMIYLEISW